MAGAQNIGEASENPVGINVTAMVDVIFCLCIFFMCSFHFKQLEGKLEAWLPKEGGPPNPTVPPPPIEEIRVFMRWDPATRATVRSLGSRPPAASDAELMGVVRADLDGYRRIHKTPPVVLDATKDVPWSDVVHLLDLCKRDKVEKVRFTEPNEYLERRLGASNP
jgi:biopolymer transport protein ExbD